MSAPDSFAAALVDRYGLAAYLGPAQVPIGTLAALKSDAADLPDKPRMMHVSIAGNIKYDAGGVVGITEAFEVGWHPVRFDKVWSAALTAVGMLWK